MSKAKTLKQKKLSQKRKQHSVNTNQNLVYTGVQINKQQTATSKPADINKYNENELLVVDPKYIKKDLIRTAILSALFIIGLLYLNWAVQNGKISLY
ncbi:hypothetical protein COX08_00075 [Candidatus Beckwithbacteria bacterium CG23_combo_of_CG06-09_8_20_14_all_34_8]|uniref:Uncharacterized protein n=1 Tax=Candidatus Beckwithbacteria bacterium CG23_combo_of_CG06-09_8_20_14_all_34_8 TaxID=1974497 RepID=A0A2H0B7G0_9BACT|nr:MAG: hypothetical protein COX08_00075 [Candidatus Beckwithbacteria bacterium CG23_combo_of_CG06-09_8_20_14_all_34_8]